MHNSASYMHFVLPQTKKIIPRTFKIRGTLVFLCPKERYKDIVRARKGKRQGKGKEKERKREMERERERERDRDRERENFL